MLHYVTTSLRTVPVCPARHRRGCDVQKLAFTGPNPGETGAPLFPQRQAHPEARTSVHTRNLFRVFPPATGSMPLETDLYR